MTYISGAQFILHDKVLIPLETLLNVLFELVFASLDLIYIRFHVLDGLFLSHYFLTNLFIFAFQTLCGVCENHFPLQLNL
jgi:hypothetical protein